MDSSSPIVIGHVRGGGWEPTLLPLLFENIEIRGQIRGSRGMKIKETFYDNRC